jgi:hypothetical protein
MLKIQFLLFGIYFCEMFEFQTRIRFLVEVKYEEMS